MPPCPIGDTSVYAPIGWPSRDAAAGGWAGGLSEEPFTTEGVPFVEEFLQIGGDFRPLCAERAEPGAALGLRHFQRAVEIRAQDVPAIQVHGSFDLARAC